MGEWGLSLMPRSRVLEPVKRVSQNSFFSLRIFPLGKKLHMAWQQNLADAMARPRKLQHNTTKKINNENGDKSSQKVIK